MSCQGVSEAPPIIHCSAGVGRSGVFAALVCIDSALRFPLRPLEVVAKEDYDYKVGSDRQESYIYLPSQHTQVFPFC